MKTFSKAYNIRIFDADTLISAIGAAMGAVMLCGFVWYIKKYIAEIKYKFPD